MLGKPPSPECLPTLFSVDSATWGLEDWVRLGAREGPSSSRLTEYPSLMSAEFRLRSVPSLDVDGDVLDEEFPALYLLVMMKSILIQNLCE